MKILIYKYKNMPQAIKASIWFLIANISINGIKFLTTPVMTRLMSESEYGTLGVFNSWQAALTVIVTLSLSAGVFSNGLLEFEKDKERFSSSILMLSSGLAIVWYGIFLVFKDIITDITQLSIFHITLMFLGFLINPALGYWSAEQKFDYKYKLLSIVTIITAILSQGISIILILKFDGNKADLAIASSAIINICVNSIIYIYILFRGKLKVKFQYWEYVIKFNLPLVPHYLSFFILSQSDRIMIANIEGMEVAGIYTLGYTASSLLQIFYSAINASMNPFTLKKMRDKEYYKIGNLANLITLFYAIISIIFIAFAPEIITILAPPSYKEVMWIIPPVVFGIYFYVIAGFFTNIEFFYKKTRLVMYSTVMSAIINIILNIYFIPKFGYVAAAYTTMVSYLVFMIFHYYFLTKIDKNNIYDIKIIINILISTICISIILSVFYYYFFIRIIIIGVIIVVAFINKDKLKMFYKKLKKINIK